MYCDLRDVGVMWIQICAWCDDRDQHDGKRISADKWAKENAPIGKRRLDEYATFARRWDEFSACWKSMQEKGDTPERRPSMATAFDIMDINRTETDRSDTDISRSPVRVGPTLEGNAGASASRLGIVTPTTTVIGGDVAEKGRIAHRDDQTRDSKYTRRVAAPWQHESDDWGTPSSLFDFLNRLYHFDVDVCASPTNTQCAVYFTKDQDGLKQEWKSGQTHWMNPPYSKAGAWSKKGSEAAQAGAVVVGLFANRSSTRWYRDYVVPSALIVQLHGRVTFIRGGKPVCSEMSSAPFQSIIVIWPKAAGARILQFCTPISAALLKMP
ncbi:MAG: DNA N-6-adenine-methyltransferase [Rhodopila sp.]|jgi:phage N-6-adenine-methyltransferase